MSAPHRCPMGVRLVALVPDIRCEQCPYPDCVGSAHEREARRLTEEAVRQALARGERPGEIARRLGISVRTVERLALEMRREARG